MLCLICFAAIGVYYTAGPVEVCAAAKRAVKEAADVLASRGHKVKLYM